MLLEYLPEVFKCFLSFVIFFIAIGYTAYRVNSRRAANDPKKRNYNPAAIMLAPFIFLFFAPLAISFLILAVLLYGVFLVFFTILLVTLRKPFLFVWWNRFSTFVGEPLLRIGTYLLALPIRMIRPGTQINQRPATI